ncbi:hypothetical protein [Winogradskya consettensis]|nr:hypothetical protein [Actinoplanes consettensis]
MASLSIAGPLSDTRGGEHSHRSTLAEEAGRPGREQSRCGLPL